MTNGIAGELANPRQLEYLHNILHAGQMLLQLINDILDLSRVEAGKVKLDETSIDVSAALASAIGLLSERARRNNIVIADEIPVEIPKLLGDSRLIKQIFLNLLSNAVKFSHRNGVVRIGVKLPTNGGLSVIFKDDGLGISAGDIKRVMLPFVQVADAMTRSHEGTGLGLPIVKSLLNLHGGKIDIDSKLGVGTTVTVHFPAERMLTNSPDA